jgi:glycosyltransferase involved in cell wall biosynthesis
VALFYTPLKHPDYPEPSGDRAIGRALLTALRAAGLAPEIASRLRTWRRTLDPAEALGVERVAAATVAALGSRYARRAPADRPSLWLSYQNYHRAPDLLGPGVARDLGVPYVLVNPSVSRKPRRTPFRPWLHAARIAIRRADLIFAMSPRDLPGLEALRGAAFAADRLRLLPPPVDLARFVVPPAERAATRARLLAGLPPDTPLLLCVAMMRPADKLDSYRVLAEALARLAGTRPSAPWRLVVVGDGAARPAVAAALGALPPGRVLDLGGLAGEALPPIYAAADIFAFPGLGEEFGIVYLEAAAAGLPVVACRGPGPTGTVVPGGGALTAPEPEAFAAGIAGLLGDPATRRRLGADARAHVADERSLATFQRRLQEGLALLGLPAVSAR